MAPTKSPAVRRPGRRPPERAAPAGARARLADELPGVAVPAGCRWPIVLGIDPGTRAMGYGALVLAPGGARALAAGVLRPARAAALPQRLAELRADLDELLRRLRPGTVVVERAFSARNVQSALRIGESRGVVLAAAAAAGARVVEIAPASAKRAVAGHGSASKPQVAAMVARLLGPSLPALADDATDALALALCHARVLELERAAGVLLPGRRARA